MFKSILPLSFIIGARFFGLFIILPVISIYASSLKGCTPLLIGLLMGIYALTQMLFQLPFGMLSDKIGRKKTLAFGLFIFILGSFICANASDIYTMIAGRFLQGAGAIGAVASALIADFSSEKMRAKAMAIMGGFIALAFSCSMILSPLLSHAFGLASLFYVSIGVSVLCLILLFLIPPEPKVIHHNVKTPISKLLKDKNLALLNLSNFLQKMLLAAAFLSIPIILVQFLSFPKEKLWEVYAIATVFGFLAMGVSGSMGGKKGLSKVLLLAGVILFIAAYLLFSLSHSVLVFSLGVVVFFMGFNLHEPIMQSLASKFAKSKEKGRALGVFNSFGYLGSFIGSMVAGYALAHDFTMLSESFIALCVLWLIAISFLKNPNDYHFLLSPLKLDLAEVNALPQVFEAYKSEQGLNIKYDSLKVSEDELKALLAGLKELA